MENNTDNTFIVYFEIFGMNKKITINNQNIKSQIEAENYVRYVVIPNHTKFVSVSKNKSKTDEKETTFKNLNETLENLSKNMDKFFNNLMGEVKK